MKENILRCTYKTFYNITGGKNMYENLYSYHEKIKGKSVWLHFKPNFREALTLFDGTSKLLSDGDIRTDGELDSDGPRTNYQDVYVSENAQWLLEDEGHSFHLYVTEKTNEITTSLGKEWNNEFNWLLKTCKADYYHKKKEEIRLYFYDVASGRLKICYKDMGFCSNDRYAYSLKRLLPTQPDCAIDKRYDKPDKSCFILGRIRKTIGLNNSKLLDFIEPVHKIELDFEKEDWDFGEYKESKENLESDLFELLSLCVLKKNSSLVVMRIRAYLGNYTAKDQQIVSQFRDKIWLAFGKGKAKELRNLADVLKNMQNCKEVKFQLRLEGETECTSYRKLCVYFENGEEDYMPAQWIFKNIHNCTDASAIYLGKLRDRYNFY